MYICYFFVIDSYVKYASRFVLPGKMRLGGGGLNRDVKRTTNRYIFNRKKKNLSSTYTYFGQFVKYVTVCICMLLYVYIYIPFL